MNRYERERLIRRNAESRRLYAYDLFMRRKYENQMSTHYAQTYGPRANLKDFQRWYWSPEGRAYASKIVNDDYKFMGEENPNPRRWNTTPTWHGKKVK